MNAAEKIIELPNPLHEVDINAEARPTDWVIEDFAARGRVTMIAGIGGSGKSRLCLQWALEASRKHRVVVVDAENALEIIQQRLAALPEVASPWPSNPRVFEAKGYEMDVDPSYLDNILSGGCDLLVLDSWISLWSKSENSSRIVKTALAVLCDLAERHDTAVVLIHHTTKEGEDYRGSSAIGGAVDATFLLTRGSVPAQRILTCTKMRYADEPRARLITTTPDGRFVVDPRPIVPITAAPAAPRSKVQVQRVPSVREIVKLEERKLISKGEAKELLHRHHGIGRGRAWWRIG